MPFATSIVGREFVGPIAAREGSWEGTNVSKFNGAEFAVLSATASASWLPVPFCIEFEELCVLICNFDFGGTLYQLLEKKDECVEGGPRMRAHTEGIS